MNEQRNKKNITNLRSRETAAERKAKRTYNKNSS